MFRLILPLIVACACASFADVFSTQTLAPEMLSTAEMLPVSRPTVLVSKMMSQARPSRLQQFLESKRADKSPAGFIQFLLDAKIPRYQIAAAGGVTIMMIGKYLDGSIPSVGVWKNWADAFEIDIEEIVRWLDQLGIVPGSTRRGPSRPSLAPLDPEEPKTLGQWVKHNRLSRGWSQSDIGKKIGIGQDPISEIENGTFVGSVETVLLLTAAFESSWKTLSASEFPEMRKMNRPTALSAYLSDWGGRFRLLRIEKNVIPSAVADILGFQGDADVLLFALENGLFDPTLLQVDCLAALLKIPAFHLLDESAAAVESSNFPITDTLAIYKSLQRIRSQTQLPVPKDLKAIYAGKTPLTMGKTYLMLRNFGKNWSDLIQPGYSEESITPLPAQLRPRERQVLQALLHPELSTESAEIARRFKELPNLDVEEKNTWAQRAKLLSMRLGLTDQTPRTLREIAGLRNVRFQAIQHTLKLTIEYLLGSPAGIRLEQRAA